MARAAKAGTERSRLEALASERDTLRRMLARVVVERDRLAAHVVAASAARDHLEEVLVAELAVRDEEKPTAAKAARATAPAAAEHRRPLVVLDADLSWEAVDGEQVRVVRPDEDVAARMADLDPARVVVNLAEPGALATLAALRAAGCTAGLWGCVAAAGRGLALGAVEPAARPLDPDAVVATLVSRASRGARIVTVGADVDAFVGLRYALTHLGMSVSMAWDARQAGDLLPLVRPEVVVLDLGLAGGEGYAILARLAGGDALPSTILVPGDDDAAGLRAALAVPANAQRAVPLGRLLARVSGCG